MNSPLHRNLNRDAKHALSNLSPLALSHREAMLRCLYGAAGILLADDWGVSAFGAPRPTATLKQGKAKSVIQIWMWGGPCHIDTFDPKPDAGYDYCGALKKAIPTNVDGLQLGESFPLLAKQADKFSLIRSMTHGNFGHETAAYWVQTGHPSGGREVYPCTGAVTSLFKGYDAGYTGLIPPYIVLTEPQGRFSESGFLGSRYKPFATGGDPGSSKFMVEGISAQGITDEHQKARRNLLNQINTFGRALNGSASLKALYDSDNQAYELILGDSGKLFDLSQEKTELRDRYGRTTFGQSCLMARRLVEKGVPYITINYKGWDTHKQHFETMRRKLPEMDKALSTLLDDLKQRGLLDSTIVWCCGEFGRTPKVQWEAPWNGGRSHWGKVFSALVAGGGFKGGHVVGSSTAKGEEVKDRPVYPADLIASMYELIGIDPNAKLPHPQGLDIPVVDKATGRLSEIM
ncbi:MAG: DUF1501 domain-containing protein [Limisphaerales bacterium]